MHRGEIWHINLDSAADSDNKKGFSAVIVSDDALDLLPLKIIVPITDWKDQYEVAPWIVRLEADIGNGTKSLAADAFQVRAVPKQRCICKKGEISNEMIQEISKALAIVLSIQF